MGPGTLYGSLGRMIEAGLIRESDKKRDPNMDDERRVYYKITGLGQKALAAELERYREDHGGRRAETPFTQQLRIWHMTATARYRNLYAKLLRLYPRPYRERFGEGMEQTFNDLCRERGKAGKGLFGFVLWVFAETSAGIIQRELSIYR